MSQVSWYFMCAFAGWMLGSVLFRRRERRRQIRAAHELMDDMTKPWGDR